MNELNRKLLVLMIEDNETDAELNARYLLKGGYDLTYERVETAEELITALGSNEWDVILADYEMPRFDAPSALKLLHHSGFDIPFLVVSGAIGEDKAVEMMKAGAHDYFLKNNLTRLATAVERELQDATERKEHRFAEEALRDSEARFRTLIEQSPLAIGISREGITVYGNQAYLDLFKIPSNEFIYGRSVIEQIAPQSREAILEKIKKRKEGLFTETTYEAIGLRTDGTQFPFHCAVTQVNLSEGMATLAFFTDITEQKLAEEATKAYQEQLKVFAAHLQSIREEERIAISRELHDNLGQCLTALKIDTSRIIKKLNKPDEVPDITTAVSIARAMVPLIDSTIELVRKITSDLRPRVLDEVGLVPAIEWQLEEFSKRTGIECKFHSELPDIKLDPAHSVGVFRIFQEAITNIMRHANASAVNVTIMQKGLSFILEIEDNGCGIKKSSLTDQQSLGLLGMKERAILFGGEVFIIGKKGSGTKVTLLIPVKNQSIHKSS